MTMRLSDDIPNVSHPMYCQEHGDLLYSTAADDDERASLLV